MVGDALARLTARELHVLALLAGGASNAAIAAELVVSSRTVDSHVRSIYAKLELPDDEQVSRRVLAALTYLGRR